MLEVLSANRGYYSIFRLGVQGDLDCRDGQGWGERISVIHRRWRSWKGGALAITRPTMRDDGGENPPDELPRKQIQLLDWEGRAPS